MAAVPLGVNDFHGPKSCRTHILADDSSEEVLARKLVCTSIGVYGVMDNTRRYVLIPDIIFCRNYDWDLPLVLYMWVFVIYSFDAYYRCGDGIRRRYKRMDNIGRIWFPSPQYP